MNRHLQRTSDRGLHAISTATVAPYNHCDVASLEIDTPLLNILLACSHFFIIKKPGNQIILPENQCHIPAEISVPDWTRVEHVRLLHHHAGSSYLGMRGKDIMVRIRISMIGSTTPRSHFRSFVLLVFPFKG